MDMKDKVIYDLIIWIDNNLDSPLDLNLLSRKTGYSKWHLQRIFKNAKNITIGEYIRKRKLFCAAVDLQIKKDSILDITVKYNFDSQQTFTRMFKKKFNMTPGWFRKNTNFHVFDIFR